MIAIRQAPESGISLKCILLIEGNFFISGKAGGANLTIPLIEAASCFSSVSSRRASCNQPLACPTPWLPG